jgi:hypothetical protein
MESISVAFVGNQQKGFLRYPTSKTVNGYPSWPALILKKAVSKKH